MQPSRYQVRVLANAYYGLSLEAGPGWRTHRDIRATILSCFNRGWITADGTLLPPGYRALYNNCFRWTK